MPNEIFKILKPRLSRSVVNKILKRLRETGSALPKVRTTPNRKTRTPSLIKNTQEKMMQTTLQVDQNLQHSKKTKLNCCHKPPKQNG